MRRPLWLAGPPHPEGDACVAPTACLIVCVEMNHRNLVGPRFDKAGNRAAVRLGARASRPQRAAGPPALMRAGRPRFRINLTATAKVDTVWCAVVSCQRGQGEASQEGR